MKTSCLFLAGAERHHEEMEELGVRLQLFSALNLLHARGGSQGIIADMYRFREESEPLGRIYMCDSGAFSVQEGVEVGKRSNKAWFKEYLDFCDEHYELFDVFIELDITDEPLEKRLEWRRQLFEVVGKKLMYVVHADSTDEEIELLRDDPQARWIGIASDFVENPKAMTEEDLRAINEVVRDIRRGNGEKVFHGLGITRLSPQWFTRLQLDSCDSTAYLRPKKYGDVIIYKNNTVHTHTIDGDDAMRKALLKKYASHWKANGLDPKKIQAMDSNELAKTGILAFKQLQDRLWHRGRAMAPKFFDPKWGLGEVTAAEVDAEESDDEFCLASVNGKPVTLVVVEDADVDFEALKSQTIVKRMEADEDNRLGDVFDHLMREEAVVATEQEAPPGAVVFPVPGIQVPAMANSMEQVRAVLDTSLHDVADLEVSLATYFAHVFPLTQAPVYLKPLTSTAIVQAGPQGEYVPGTEKRTKAVGTLLKMLPQVVCETCSINTSCPEFKEGATCAYNSMFDRFSVREADNVIPVATALVDASVQRALRAVAQEKALNGGQLDSRTSSAIDASLKHLSDLDKLKTAHHIAEESVTLTVRKSGGKGGGILAELFGGGSRPAPSQAPTPTVIDLGTQARPPDDE